MNPRYSRLTAGAGLLALLALSSCKKQIFDHIKDHPLEVARCCQVETISFTNPGELSNSYKINYDAEGKPVSVLETMHGFPPVDYHFRYDTRGRLKDYLITDAGGGTVAFQWVRYFYPGPSMMGDSSWEYQDNYSTRTNPDYSDTSLFEGVTLYHLDALGRPVSYTFNGRFGSSGSGIIQYDHNGNRIIPGVTYDDKVNIYQTNKIWQQVYGDYSRNNPYTPATAVLPASITGYNRYGLPLGYLLVGQDPISNPAYLFGFPYTTMDITYSCDSTKLAKAY